MSLCFMGSLWEHPDSTLKKGIIHKQMQLLLLSAWHIHETAAHLQELLSVTCKFYLDWYFKCQFKGIFCTIWSLLSLNCLSESCVYIQRFYKILYSLNGSDLNLRLYIVGVLVINVDKRMFQKSICVKVSKIKRLKWKYSYVSFPPIKKERIVLMSGFWPTKEEDTL